MQCVTMGWGLCVLVSLCLVPLVFTAKRIKIDVATGRGHRAGTDSYVRMIVLMDRGFSEWLYLDKVWVDDRKPRTTDVYLKSICDCGKINGFLIKLDGSDDWFLQWATVMDYSDKTDGAACYLDDWMGPHDMSACMSKDNPNLSYWEYRLRRDPQSCFEVGNVRRLREFRWGGTKLQNLTSRFYYSSKKSKLMGRCNYWVKVNPVHSASVVKHEGKWKVKTVDQEDAPEICRQDKPRPKQRTITRRDTCLERHWDEGYGKC